MQAMLARIEEVDARIEALRARCGASFESTLARIQQFDQGVLAELKTVLVEVEKVKSNLLQKTGAIEARAQGMIPPP